MNLYYNSNCPICGNSFEANLCAKIQECEYETTDHIFEVHTCKECNTLLLNPRPSEADFDVIYPENYYAYADFEDEKTTKTQSIMQAIFKKIRKKNLEHSIMRCVETPKDRGLRVLDIGCGNGMQLDLVKEFYPDTETWGVDFSAKSIAVVNKHGHNGLIGKFEDVDFPTEYFDLIISMHVIEHVGSPDQFVEEAMKLINAKGILVLATPNTDCLDFRMFGNKHWGGYHTPRHWYLFCQKSFEKLAGRLNFRLVDIHYYTLSSFTVVTLHSLSKTFFGNGFANKVFPPVKILYGGVYEFFLLSTIAVLDRIVLKVTGKGNAMWVTLGKDNPSYEQR